jgi:hypothetical protein
MDQDKKKQQEELKTRQRLRWANRPEEREKEIETTRQFLEDEIKRSSPFCQHCGQTVEDASLLEDHRVDQCPVLNKQHRAAIWAHTNQIVAELGPFVKVVEDAVLADVLPVRSRANSPLWLE